ncbi:MAG: response regulator [Sediminibacterium sp.]|nr:response regulator [Sediminibacterium sp.]
MNKTAKILVVDDDPYILLSLEFLMKKAGYDVLIARNGNETIEILKNNIPDIVLLDIMMPDIDGYEICKMIKSTPNLKNAKVVFLSAKTKQSDIQKGYNVGADLFITKPFSTRNLKQEVEKLLNSL